MSQHQENNSNSTPKAALEWRPNKGAQERFHSLFAFERAYGGAAGGGKTESLLREVLRQVHIPGYKAAIFRRTYPELEQSLIERAYEIYPAHGGRPKNKGRIWYFPTGKGSLPSKVIFAHLEHETDVHIYQSAQFDVLGFDEATTFSEYQYVYMRSRVRGTNPAIRRYIVLGTNPGNIGHTWFKTRFIDGREPFKRYYFRMDGDREVETDKTDKKALSRVFVPAKVWDNPPLLENDPGYLNRLESLDPVTRRMLLNGDWDVFAGQYFSQFRRDTHVVEPFEVPPSWKRYVGIDYGGTAPFAAIFIAVDYDGNAYVYKEYYEKGKTAFENARGVQALYVDPESQAPREKIDAFFIDPSTFSRDARGETIAEIIRRPNRDLGYLGIPVIPASNVRLAGWNSIREYLSEDNGKPKLRIFSHCTNLIQFLPQMIHDRFRPEDLDTTMEDHAPDALRYVLQSLRDRKSARPVSAIEQKIRNLIHPSRAFNPNEFYSRVSGLNR